MEDFHLHYRQYLLSLYAKATIHSSNHKPMLPIKTQPENAEEHVLQNMHRNDSRQLAAKPQTYMLHGSKSG